MALGHDDEVKINEKSKEIYGTKINALYVFAVKIILLKILFNIVLFNSEANKGIYDGHSML